MSAVLASDPSRGLFLKGAALDDCYRGPSHSQGVRNGHGTYVYPNRFYAYDGEYVEGKKHGKPVPWVQHTHTPIIDH